MSGPDVRSTTAVSAKITKVSRASISSDQIGYAPSETICHTAWIPTMIAAIRAQVCVASRARADGKHGDAEQ
jgi:hypothetical protein